MKSQVVILAGGLGTRLRPLTEKVPKPLVEVAGQPFLYWQLQDLSLQGYRRVVLLVSYLGEQIEAFFGDGSKLGMEIRYSYEPQPMGTGGAIKNALALLDEKFILLNGDSFLRAPLDAMAEAFDNPEFDAMLAVYDNRVQTPVIPNVKVQGERVSAYEKGAGPARGFECIDAGVYLLKRWLFERAQERFQLEDLWPDLIPQGKVGAFQVAERFYDIGTPERLNEFEEKVRDYFKNTLSH